MRKKGKIIKSLDGEIPLPEAMIQHIQSFLSREEAARTTILSKSWYNAWLTRPVLDFDTRDFNCFYPESKHVFEEFVTKTIQRYQNSSMKIDSFRLCCYISYICEASSHSLMIVNAMKMGATTVELQKCSCALPQEVLRSETLLRLSLINCKVDGNYDIRCSRLKSLTMDRVDIKSHDVKELISCCILLEELSLSHFHHLPLWKSMNPFELHKLRRLSLRFVYVGSIFSADFSSKFPCLKDLSIVHCYGCIDIQITSTSLETVYLKTDKVSDVAKFDVPNIRKFTYPCSGLPSYLSINGPSREWKFDISIESNHLHRTSWFINLKKVLKKFRLSRISLCINVYPPSRPQRTELEDEFDVEAVPKPLMVENLMIKTPSKVCSALVIRLLGVFRPKFITHHDCDSYAWVLDDIESIDTRCMRVIQALFVSNWEDMFGQFGLKKVNVEIYDKFDAEWRPLELKKPKTDSKAKVRLHLIWED